MSQRKKLNLNISQEKKEMKKKGFRSQEMKNIFNAI